MPISQTAAVEPPTVFPVTVQMRAGATSVVVRCEADSLPEVLHWGEDLGALTTFSLESWAGVRAGIVSGGADVVPRVSLVPSQAEGWRGTPGLMGTRGGVAGFPGFKPTRVRVVAADGTDGAPTGLRVDAHDPETQLALGLELRLEASGLLRMRAWLTNEGSDDYALDCLLLALPTPADESEVVDQSGHHLRERDTARHEFTIGTHQRVTWVARGHAASTIHGTCRPATGWGSGRTHYVHVGWSGNTRTLAERDVLGHSVLLAGELLLPGEVVLAPGESYEMPWVVATWGQGFDEASGRIHAFLRARESHPATPRPVTFNAWEAVYFEQSLDRLLPLVDVAAEVGAERFVLDDGWFGSRRDDSSGLGDWVVSSAVWPDGLAPLARAVHAHGMEFGLWFEPEAINLDSDAARAHPDWVLSPRTRRPQEARRQQVIDLTNPEAFEHVLGQMRRVLNDASVDYVKWDFNRDMYEAVSPLSGRPAYHAQTQAVYRLMDILLAEFPGLEIESCAGGGGRIDLGMMERAVRVWGSDCIDPLERLGIEAGTSLLLPPELVGSHVASTTSHTTGRTLNLTLRASTAMFSHMGIEWNLLEAAESERRELAAWIALHKKLRPLLHTGRTFHADHPDAGWRVRGVVSDDGSDAVFQLVRVTTSPVRPGPALRLPGLTPEADYALTELLPEGVASSVGDGEHARSLVWWPRGVTVPGSVLGTVGLRFPDLDPERALLVRLTRA